MPALEIDVRPNGPFPQVLYETFMEQAHIAGKYLDAPLWDHLKPEDQQFWRSMAYRIMGRYLANPKKPHARSVTNVDNVPNYRR